MSMKFEFDSGPVDDDGPNHSTGNGGVWAINTRRYTVRSIHPPAGVVIEDMYGRRWMLTAWPLADGYSRVEEPEDEVGKIELRNTAAEISRIVEVLQDTLPLLGVGLDEQEEIIHPLLMLTKETF